MKIKGLIFDLDGTLLDTINDIRNAVNIILARYDSELISEKEFHKLIGNGQKTLLSMAFNYKKSKEEIDKISVEYSKVYEDNLIIHTKPYPGIKELLSCFEKTGIKMAVLSNKRDILVKKLIKHFYPDINFIEIMGNTENMPLKPDPEAALYISEKMGLLPDEVAFVGDSYQDALTANNGKMTAISVLWGYQTKETIDSKSKPDYYFKCPEEFIDFITGRINK